MSRNLLNVIVDGISLLKGKNPAVWAAEARFALVKMEMPKLSETSLESLQKSIDRMESLLDK